MQFYLKFTKEWLIVTGIKSQEEQYSEISSSIQVDFFADQNLQPK